MASFLKTQAVRSKRHLMNVAALDCQHCGMAGHTQAAHSNQGIHGKSMARKADDQYTAALCQYCHAEIDQGAHLSKQQRQQMWTDAWISTAKELINRNQWNFEIPEEMK